MKFEKLDKLDNKVKVGLVIIICFIFSILIFNFVRNTIAIDSEGYLESQVVENISFTNANIKTENGITMYSVSIQNTTNNEYKLSTIDVIFKDKDNNEIETLNGYVGDSLEAKEEKVLEVSVDKELKDINSITYVVNK